MIGLDTNVLVRYIMQDDPIQSVQSSNLIESLTAEAPGFVPMVVVVELVWVLSSAYDMKRAQIAQVLDMLLRTKELIVDRADLVVKAQRVFNSSSADFADCLIERLAASAGCTKTMTFDIGAAKAAGMMLIQ